MKGILEYKDFTAEIKDVDFKSRTVTGWWASYGNKDHDSDIIEPGAARKTIMERGPKGANDIFFLNQHNWDQPHVRPHVLEDTEKGIYFEATMPISSNGEMTSYSKDALILYETGVVGQHSIGFNTLKYDTKGSWADGTFVRFIKEIKLFEGSNVTLGANSNTPFSGFKSLTMEQASDQVNKIVKLLRNGTLTDETFVLLEIGLKQLQKYSYELGKAESLKEKTDEPTVEVTPTEVEPVDLSEYVKCLTNFKF